ncbi:hypothetical protein LF887_03460 [Chryseobacterium sp. MEBOG06]|uniref:S41 family peptidase n=1 Tax=Chryseobacterium sp. MEBOG06 TaxID=2879938 RepID=UPI001F005367|nr:S41 family peptidase [Chryseobacterium sp. MEBOG06]UKB84714.1 hypothetical protein LF887_03460 [Chryseobacterium sp. MEBOG06]
MTLNIIYSMSNSLYLKMKMPFPGYNVYGEKKEGYDLKTITGTKTENDVVYLPIELHNINIKYPTTSFILQYKTANVKKFDINIIRKRDTIKIQNVKNTEDGYQFPVEKIFSSSDNILGIEYKIYKQEDSKPYEFFIGRMDIAYYNEYEDISPFNASYEKLTAIPSPSAFGLYTLYSHYPKEYLQNMVLSNISIEYPDSYKKALLQLTGDNIKRYSFYEEKKIKKKNVAQKFEKLAATLLNTEIDDCELTEKLNNFLFENFYDPHFKINSRCGQGERKLSPLRVQKVSKRYIIVANLDSGLQQQVPLGSELLSVGKKKISDYKKEKDHYLNDKVIDKINYLLSGKVGEEVLVQLKSNGVEKTVSFKIKDGYPIPDNFKPKQGQFKVTDAVSYFKINLFSREIPTLFVNHLKEINASKGLVIDLRGNGGGEGNEGARLLSYMINKDFKYTDILNRDTKNLDSLVVSTNAALFSVDENKKIIVLVDHNTACAAELFVRALKENRKRVTVIGRERSAGSITPTYNITFGDKYKTTLLTGSYAPYKYVLKNPKNVGIEPDIMVDINDVYDLQPYNDKVFTEAVKVVTVP